MNIGELLVKMGIVQDRSSFSQAEDALKKLKSTAVKLLGAIGIGISLKSLNNIAEQYQALRDKVGDFTKSHEEARNAQREILATSKNLHKSFGEITNQVESLIKNGKAANVEDALKKINEEAKKSGTITLTLGSYIQSMKDEFGLWLADLWTSTGVTETLGNLLQEIFKRVMAGLEKLRPYIQRLIRFVLSGVDKIIRLIDRVCGWITKAVDFLGGVENVLRLIGIAIGIIVGFNLIQKVMAFLSVLNPVTLILGGLLLLLEDLYVFMAGGDSLTGEMFDALGIGADNARENILTMFDDLKTSIQDLFDYIGEHKEDLVAIFGKVAPVLLFVVALLNPIPTLIGAIIGLLIIAAGNWEAVKVKVEEFKKEVEEAYQWVKDIVDLLADTTVGKWISEWQNQKKKVNKDQLFQNEFSSVEQMQGKHYDNLSLDEATDKFKELAAMSRIYGEDAPEQFAEGLEENVDKPVGVIEKLCEMVKALIHYSVPDEGPLADSDQWMPDMMKLLADGIRENSPMVRSAIETVANMIKSTFMEVLDPTTAKQWGTDFMQGLANGITEGSALVQAQVQALAQQMSAPLHFSAPDEGPLADYESWMPDFMQGLASGIAENAGIVLDQLRSMTGEMESIIGAEIANLGSLTAAMNSSVNNISQNVRITNQFSGDRAAQLQGAKAMDKSAKDATAYMADALRFGR